MVKKEQSIKCTKGWCKNHIFEMIPKDSKSYFRRKLRLRMCPKLNKFHNVFENVMPTVHHDIRHYTPCFILEEERVPKSPNRNSISKMTKNSLKTTKVKCKSNKTNSAPQYHSHNQYQVKHGSRKNYCSVCKDDYSDYLEHTGHQKHINNLRINKFTAFILQMQEHFQVLNEVSLKIADQVAETDKSASSTS